MFMVPAAVLAAVLFASSAFADIDSAGMPANSSDLARICESARLTDLERRECRAMFKSADDDTARQAAYRTFVERIAGAAK